ncbi:hypothetical protein JI721_12680 [Alicyclobacillus cycloheptanicus]|uniref:Succinate dehydrogenase hydrophobic anchor subunit n=1 Tax=Alicyclobacillus cycloheptanicus TaxID=1457 RepID=A0ABT9XER7_9BACL|nr:hypothetical protein [Alicyclobacillus cycloheptanicus]MDQ0188788.1 succinate dehydrogenase hydrophobic anchor subunit [Alicyclobacillus cycloheptanicus]WDM00555.1 hypothetical protein JI721_12680 [Alicyclobacillus cycloheptanicus]
MRNRIILGIALIVYCIVTAYTLYVQVEARIRAASFARNGLGGGFTPGSGGFASAAGGARAMFGGAFGASSWLSIISLICVGVIIAIAMMPSAAPSPVWVKVFAGIAMLLVLAQVVTGLIHPRQAAGIGTYRHFYQQSNGTYAYGGSGSSQPGGTGSTGGTSE